MKLKKDTEETVLELYQKRLFFVGQKGSIEITNEKLQICNSEGLCEQSTLSTLYPGVTMETLDNYSFKIVQQNLVDCIINNRDPIPTGEDNLKTLNLVFNGYESAEKHQVVTV